MKRLGVRYPVALDNDYGTWNAYANQYWPAEYLIDRTGHVRHIHFGEGEYDETERDIRKLLQAAAAAAPPAAHSADRTPTELARPSRTSATQRIDRYAGSPVQADQSRGVQFPRSARRGRVAYDGTWTVESERIVAGEQRAAAAAFHAQKVYLVLGGTATCA